MIESLGDITTAALLKGKHVTVMPDDIQRPAMARLQMLDAAEVIDDLMAAPLARPQGLPGAAPGTWVVMFVDNWRLRFVWPDGGICSAGGNATILREDLDRELIYMSDVTDGPRLTPVHPGEILKEQFLDPMEISVYALANAIKVPRSRANDIVLGRRTITADTALRLGRYLGTSAEFWIRLQAHHDLDRARREDGAAISGEVDPREA